MLGKAENIIILYIKTNQKQNIVQWFLHSIKLLYIYILFDTILAN